jgi:hypothetical protein
MISRITHGLIACAAAYSISALARGGVEEPS